MEFVGDRNPEPAEPTSVVNRREASVDPEVVTVEKRRRTRIVDCSRDGISIDDLPKPLVECGCGECGPMVDPLDRFDGGNGLDWSAFDTASWAQSVCPNPQPITLERAGEVFKRYAKAKLNDDSRTSKVERELSNYRKIMERDRYARENYGDNLTTALLSFRVRPIARDGVNRRWLSPIILADALIEPRSDVLRRAKSIQEHVDDYHYAWVITGTELYSTPHYHCYFWMDDPDDTVAPFDFRSAIERHCEGHMAFEEDHPKETDDGEQKAVTVRHSPVIVDTEKGTTVITEDGTKLDMSALRREIRRNENEPYHEATKGAVYVAKQLPYLCALDDPHPVDCQSAAIKWTHNAIRGYNWFGCSQLPDEPDNR